MESDSTLGFRGRVGLDAYRDAIGAVLVDHTVESDRPDSFRGRLAVEEIGGMVLVDTSITAMRAVHSPAQVPGDGSVFVMTVTMADGTLAHRKGEEVIRPGRLTVVPSEEGFDVRYRGPAQIQYLVLPGDVVRTRYPHLDGPIRSTSLTEAGAELVAHLGAVRAELARSDLGARARAALAGLVDPVVDGLVAEIEGAGPGGRLAAVRLAAERFIDRHLGDPALRPGGVAAAIQVPLSTLQRAFRAGDVTVSSHIRSRRLERAAHRLATEPVAVARVAAEVGYGSVAQFAAHFHEHHGVRPVAGGPA